MKQTKVKRLHTEFNPDLYKLHISLSDDGLSFNGEVEITGHKTGRPSKRITLHQKDLTIKSAQLTYHDKKGHVEHEVARINKHGRYDELRLHTNATLYPGKYQIVVKFSGKITPNMNGLYPSVFEEDGHTKKILATQLESHHAREIFPCIDEPSAKAVFELSLTTNDNLTVIANTPVSKQQKLENGLLFTVFEPSPKMSTYLLAFAVGELAYKEAKTKSGIKVRTYATRQNIEFVDFALEVAVKCIDFYEDYFDIKYPLPKCDMVALPDFSSGAMENWGLITYREQCMLVDEKNTSLPTKQFVAMVVAHELAHMWFGNLVTMRWWTDLWLNEGFATWIEYMAIDKLFPDWQMWTQFVVDEQQQALKLDALDNTHPIEVAVGHPDEIRTIFDAISYSKGASIINQLHAYLGADDFKKGLNLYLKKHAYANTDTIDLWNALSEASGKDVASFMHNWTAKPGYPIVHVSSSDGKLHLSQKRFYMRTPQELAHDHSWHIPLLDNRLGEAAILASSNVSLKLPSDEPLYLNKQRSGFYRVTYENDLLEQLAVLIDNSKLDPLDRLGLLSDLFEASKSGNVDTVTTLKFLEHYSSEDNAAVWDIIASIIAGIKLILGSPSLRQAIKPYVIDLAIKQYERLGWDHQEHDNYFDKMLRPTILGLLASADYPEIVKKCHELFNKATETDDIDSEYRISASSVEMKRGIEIDPDMRGVVFGTVSRMGDQKVFDKLLELHSNTVLSEEKLTLAAAITNFSDEAIIRQALAFIKSGQVRMQDVSYWIAYSFVNHHAKSLTWQWLKDNWQWLHKNLGTDLSFFRMPIYAARVHSDEMFIAEYQEFFESVMTPALQRSYKQGLEMLQWHIDWRTRDREQVLEFFKQFRPN